VIPADNLGTRPQTPCSVGDTLKMKELNWLPNCNPTTNRRMEKLCEDNFSGVLTTWEISDWRLRKPGDNAWASVFKDQTATLKHTRIAPRQRSEPGGRSG